MVQPPPPEELELAEDELELDELLEEELELDEEDELLEEEELALLLVDEPEAAELLLEPAPPIPVQPPAPPAPPTPVVLLEEVGVGIHTVPSPPSPSLKRLPVSAPPQAARVSAAAKRAFVDKNRAMYIGL